MSVSTPSQQRVSQATPPTGPDRPWEYNRGLRIILHDSESCEECLRWIGHFVKSLTKDERSLKTARHALESASDVQKDVDDAQERRDSAFIKLAQARQALKIAQDTLKKVQMDRVIAMRANKDLKSKSLDKLNAHVTHLCHDLQTTYCNSPPMIKTCTFHMQKPLRDHIY